MGTPELKASGGKQKEFQAWNGQADPAYGSAKVPSCAFIIIINSDNYTLLKVL